MATCEKGPRPKSSFADVMGSGRTNEVTAHTRPSGLDLVRNPLKPGTAVQMNAEPPHEVFVVPSSGRRIPVRNGNTVVPKQSGIA